jgi:hypothetical protein
LLFVLAATLCPVSNASALEPAQIGPSVKRADGAWLAMRNLKFCLANLGIPAPDLRAEPPGGPADFLDRIAKASGADC